MNRVILAFLGGVACAAAVAAIAEPVRVPVDSDDKGTAYIAPNVNSTETSARTNGATVGVQRPDGSALEAGTDTSGKRPTYSVGAKTGGDVSFSGGAHSDGKANTGVKAGVTIKY
ncbi:hypothetical protein GmRootV35_19870 [Variovorax sp. V35]|uniref:Uncharacterized protein n=1 Tax=Variovorax boronicumulans TaxID=436515 RepID=A0AAW8DYM3_9BURK|nr:hypothetical protein [Variovorax boronicumulans]MDP9879186.1 hypothetical protein [Variovorax boronicumulans]MDP9924470.1 hypothetical protein [Variovorax boronicumulans]